MNAITDLKQYSKRVPRVKKVEIYEQTKLSNVRVIFHYKNNIELIFSYQGTIRTGAKFDISVVGIKFAYFLQLREDPKLSTYTWTLDYRYSSDFGETNLKL